MRGVRGWMGIVLSQFGHFPFSLHLVVHRSAVVVVSLLRLSVEPALRAVFAAFSSSSSSPSLWLSLESECGEVNLPRSSSARLFVLLTFLFGLPESTCCCMEVDFTDIDLLLVGDGALQTVHAWGRQKSSAGFGNFLWWAGPLHGAVSLSRG